MGYQEIGVLSIQNPKMDEMSRQLVQTTNKKCPYRSGVKPRTSTHHAAMLLPVIMMPLRGQELVITCRR